MRPHFLHNVSACSLAVLPVGAGLLLAVSGCARAPEGPTQGLRMAVTMRFNGPVNDAYHYFVLIRNAADPSGQNGPIPVILPPYMNGFATGQNAATAGFTDYVEYSRNQRQPTASGFGLYHLPEGIGGDPNRNIFAARGEPEYTDASPGGSLLRFELDLSRLQPSSGEPDPNNGQLPQYLQINLIATTTTPTDPIVPDPRKYVDAFGDQRLGSGSFNRYLTIETTQNRLYESSTVPGDQAYEPVGDTYPSDADPAVDLVYWSVRISGR